MREKKGMDLDRRGEDLEAEGGKIRRTSIFNKIKIETNKMTILLNVIYNRSNKIPL